MAANVIPNAILRRIHNTLQRTLNDFEGRDSFTTLIAMAPAEQYAIPPLLHGVCPPQAAEPCIHTVTGRRCRLLICLDLGNRFHFSHSSLCILDQAQTSPAHSPHRNSSNPFAVNPTLNLAMAHIGHCMRSRRGGTRGDIIRTLASTSSDTVSPDSCTDLLNPLSSPSSRYPNTRSGRGRARFQATEGRDVAVRSANFPLPPYPAPHNTQFHFHSTVNRPIITATITISFSEESELQAPLSGLKNKQSREALGSRDISTLGNQQHNEGRAALHGKAIAGGPSVEEGKHKDAKALGSRPNDTSDMQMGTGGTEEAPPTQGRGMSDANDDWYQFVVSGRRGTRPEGSIVLTRGN